MYGGISLFLQMQTLPPWKRLLPVLVVFAASLGLLWLFRLAFPIGYFGLALALVCASWLFGWQGGLLCLAGFSVALVAAYRLVSGVVGWQSPGLTSFLAAALTGLMVCLGVGALRSVTRALLAERQQFTHLQQAYEREHALNEWKDQALQDLNHELRLPLTQIEGYLELLETYRDDLDAATLGQFIALARGGCDELLNLVRTTIETLQASPTQQPVHLSVFALRHAIHTTLAHCDAQLLQNHPVRLDIDDELQVRADASYVRQVMRNLLTNACKYTPAGTSILISAASTNAADHPHRECGMVCVRVQDRGPGIPPEQQARIFERFVRLPGATTSAQPGSGLGLAICKQLVEVMGGTIWVESTGREGEGSCFSFTLASGSQSSTQGVAMSNGEYDGKAQARIQGEQKSLAVSAL